MKTAIYGEVWSALEVDIHPEWYFTARLNDDGSDRYLAVKKMEWRTIDYYRGRIGEDPMREISILTRLSAPGHPNVLRMVDALHDGTFVYLLTPFIGGGEMFDWVSQHGGLPEEVAKALFRQLIEGTEYIHSQGICHADMSLENVLVDRTHSNAHIIDLGMSLIMPMNHEGLRMMSVPDLRRPKPSYCPPEKFHGEAHDGVKVDVFSLGAMLFMMLTGLRPFAAATRTDPSFERVVFQGDVQGFLGDRGVPLLSVEAADLVRQMMAYRAEDRPLPQQALEHAWFI